MNKEHDPILEKLDILTKRINALTLVIACKPNSEQINELLKKKSLTEQIRILKEWDFSNEIMASIIGTTPESVRVRAIQMKSKGEKEKQPKPEQKATQ
jgi:hypothetical protein